MMNESEFVVAIVGSLILTRQWSTNGNPGFTRILDVFKISNISFANLKTLIHSFQVFPENNDQGTPIASSPIISKELSWAGFVILRGDNNIAIYYIVVGTHEQIKNVNEAGIPLKCVGKDLQDAHKTVAHKNKLELVLFSFHFHEGSGSNPPEFLREFLYNVFDKRLDIFLTHGAHYLRGIKIYKGRPIFYGLGNFAFKSERIEKLPSRHYNNRKHNHSLYPRAVQMIIGREFINVKKCWESIALVIIYKNNKLKEIPIYPFSLGYEKPSKERGTPGIAEPNLKEQIIRRLSNLFQQYITKLLNHKTNNLEIIKCINTMFNVQTIE